MSNPAATSSVRLLALTQPKPTPRSESFVQSLTLAGAVGDDIDEIRLVRPRTAFTPGRRRSSPQRPRRDRAGDATSKLADGTLLIDRVTSASPNRPRTRAEAPRQLVGGTASEPTLVPTAAAIAEAIARSRAAGLLLGEEGDEDGDDDDDAETCSDVDCEDDEEEQEISDFDDDQESEESTADIVAKLKRMELETPTSSGGDGDGEVSLEEVAVLLTSKAFVQPDVYVKSPITPSLFEDGDAVLYFPPENEAGECLWSIDADGKLNNALRRAGFKLVKGGKKWIGYWGKHFPVERFKLVQPWQKVNHFPMSFEIGRKDRMYVNVSRMRERAGAHTVDFLPQTFLLPHQRRNLKNQFNTSALWIVKPPASARGLGIRLAAKWTDVPRKREVVVSRYISNPYLIDGKKFDLRLYVAVTSFDPLRIYLFREGLVRFAADQYSSSTNTHNVKNRFAHLTNYSVSKKNKGGKPRFQANEPLSGKFNTSSSKWDLETLREYLALRSIDFGRVMESIKCLVVKTIISANTVNASGVRLCVPNSASCYELFGFDVLLDSDLKPWLMEVNISPSLKASCDMDYNLKSRMVTDLLNLVGIRIKDLEASRIKKYKDNWKRPGLSNKERSKHREHYRNKDYDCLGELSGDDIKILKETEDEVK
ncbi:Tubulin polyglutamylase ttll4 [Irineochytrium annulatum]|nr:Tubulin polyglutamylase ttll4 [Irineochytrium annulatum]